MANTIILKRSATPGKVPTTSQLALGEIAINTYDGLIYIKKDDGTPSVVQIGGVTSVNGKTGDAVLHTDDISDSGHTNKWFSNSLARGAISAGTGISYNSGTGVISTAQSITTSASPTFAGLTLTGDATTRSILPAADNTYSLGSPTMAWKDVYVGPGSLYVNGKEVIHDTSGTMTFTADLDQNMRITTTGAGILQLGSSSTNVNIDGTLQLASGKRITDSAGVNVQFGDPINMNSDKIINLGAPSANTDAATKKYVDDTVGAISTSSITQGNSNVTVVDTGTGQVQVNVDGTTALTVTSAGVVVAGNFTVQGTTTTVESNTIALADNIITLNSDATGAPTQNAGIEVKRGDSANVQIRWNEGSQKWTFTNDGSVYSPMAVNTDDLTEGSTNLYHTTARARSALSASTSTGVSYNSTTGVISLGSIPNTALTNNSITINGASVALGGTRTLVTDDVAEGSTNLYFTNTRARGAVSATAGTGLSYNSTTGAFSLASIPNSSLTNTTVTVGTTGIALGGTSTTLAGLTSVTATTFTGALSGNATTATTLQNARTINGVSFDGSSNVTVHTAGTGISVSGATVSIDTATTVDKTTAQTLTNKSLSDNTTYIIDETDGTKKAQFQAGSITTNTTRTYTLPDVNGTLVTTGDTGSVTNTMLAGSIANSKLSNSSITINGNSVSLGGSVTVTAQAANALTIGNGLSGTSYNGSGAVTIAIDTATTVDKNSLQTLTNKSVQDGSFFIIDDADATKKVAFSVGGLTTGTTRTLTVGDVSGTIVTTGDTGSVTNTMLAGSIANAKLTNSSVTVGTTAISLGASSTTLAGLTSVTSTSFVGALTGNASTATTLQTARAINGVNFDGSAAITVKASTTNALTIGTGLSGTSFDGGSAVTIAIDSTVATLTGSQTLTNKTLTSPAITTPTVTGATVMKTGSTSVADEYVVYLNASATTANQVLDSLATASYTSARYLIEAVTASDTEMVEVVVTFAGANVYLNSTSLISSASAFQAVYDADISGGNLRLLVTPTNANTKFKVRATAFKAI